MQKTLLLLAILALFLMGPQLMAQCPLSGLICTIPELYGPKGLTLPNPFHQAHFESDFQASFTPLNSAIGTELSLLPQPSPSSGFVFTFDRSLGVFVPSSQNLGPILSERAETVGRHKTFVAFTYQRFGFGSLDGIGFKHFPAVFTHIDCCNPDGSKRTASSPPSPGDPTFERDFIVTDNRLDLKVNQYTLFATFGLTNRVDVSVAVPLLDVFFQVASDARIVRNSTPGKFGYAHFFDPACVSSTVPVPPALLACQAASTEKVFTNAGAASGIGDVQFRVKGTVWKGEKAGLAAGLDVRTPSGDAANFLGSGAAGVKPFVALSYAAKLAPHVNVGYQWNGDSILAGSTLGAKGRLPNQFLYSAGADYGVAKRLTLSGDFIGQVLFDTETAKLGPYVDILGQVHTDIPQTSFARENLNLTDLALGMKLNPIGRLVLTGNILLSLTDTGLRAKVVPLGGISYTF